MKKIFTLFLLLPALLFAQQEITLMSYNLLNYPGNDTTIRNPHFRTVLENTLPDILVVQEIQSQQGMNGFLANVLNSVSDGYDAGEFIDGPDSDNGIFYKTDKFTFIDNLPIRTQLRDINQFILKNNFGGDTIRIFSTHLKASTGSSNELRREAEVDALRSITDEFHSGAYYLVTGDFNIYKSSEAAYQRLIEESGSGYFIDIIEMSGTWNNSSYSRYHTQSPRMRQFGGGATGGLDDRFDMILMSRSIVEEGGITYVQNSYTAYGNDGNHYNDSINRPPNTAVGQQIADALHYASDHLPVIAKFKFDAPVPVELLAFTAERNSANGVELVWHTASETNNSGFEISRKSGNNWTFLGFVPGSGTSTQKNIYSFTDNFAGQNDLTYRLKQIDFDGSSNVYYANSSAGINLNYSLEQNYPNPFNPSTKISFAIPSDEFVTLKIYDVLGNEVALLINELLPQGKHDVEFNAPDLSSGIYFYRLKAGDFSAQRKMLLIK